MPDALVPPIAGLGVYAVELAHPFGSIAVGCLDQQMVVVVHQAPCIACPVELVDDLLQRYQEYQPALVAGHESGLRTCLEPGKNPVKKFLFSSLLCHNLCLSTESKWPWRLIVRKRVASIMPRFSIKASVA